MGLRMVHISWKQKVPSISMCFCWVRIAKKLNWERERARGREWMRGTKRNAHKLCPNIQLPNSVRWLVGWLALPCFTSNRRSFPNGAHYVADNIVVASNSTKIHSFVQYIYLFFPPNSHSKLINIKTELVSHNVGSAPCTMCAIQISMVRTF